VLELAELVATGLSERGAGELVQQGSEVATAACEAVDRRDHQA